MAVDAFDLYPVVGAAGPVGLFKVLADNTLQTEARDMLKQDHGFVSSVSDRPMTPMLITR